MSLSALETTVCQQQAHDISFSLLPTLYLTVYVTPAMVCFLAIGTPAIENYIFASKQSFNVKYASRAVSVLITIPDSAMEQGLA